MELFTNITSIKNYLREQQSERKRIGFVHTMGYLHEGQLSLVRRAVAETDLTVVSIFVHSIHRLKTPEDPKKYRNLDQDLYYIQKAGAEVAFTPSAAEMYGTDFLTSVQVNKISETIGTIDGASRSGHFQGFTTIVAKLFNIIRPDKAYFGQKDGQQVVVIQKMVQDLNMDVEVIICPTVREADGLAISSRNRYLNMEERNQATVLYQALMAAKKLWLNGENDPIKIKKRMAEIISNKPLAQIEYISIVDTASLQKTAPISGPVMIALAVKFGATRLIDNIII